MKHRTYTRLDALQAAGSSPVREGGIEVTSGYRFVSDASKDRYAITAIPSAAKGITFTLNHSGEIHP